MSNPTQSDITIVNKSQLCTILAVARTTLDGLITQGMPVQNDPGKHGHKWEFHVPTVVKWYADHLVERERRKAQSDPEGMTQQEANRVKAVNDAEMSQIDLDERLKQVVEIDEIGKQWDQLVVRCRQRLRGMGIKLAPQLVGEENEKVISKTINDEVDDALLELSGQ